ncbi:MAG: divalent metal cation transporter [Bacteroidota bacterium]
MSFSLRKFGPGLLFAGAAIGVSHLVQSTRAGADFGFGLVWALILINLVKYPFFQFGPKYASATGETLLDGYKRLGKGLLFAYFLVNLATMFTIQTAVTIVTAGLAVSLFDGLLSVDVGVEIWTVIILVISVIILLRGKYNFLDKLIKIIIIALTLSTLIAVVVAFAKVKSPISIQQVIPEVQEIGFLIAFMGWMPAPLDISIWQSIWTVEKKVNNHQYDSKTSNWDFNVGYVFTIIIGLGFIALGALVMFGTGMDFSNQAGKFSNQLISVYTTNLGSWSYSLIAIAAFTAMFSTTITTLDASPKAMHNTSRLLFPSKFKSSYLFWILLLAFGTIFIFFFLASEMGLLIKIATILSFLTAPFYAIMNYVLISGKNTPKKDRPSMIMHIWSWIGILFLLGFSCWYLSTVL